MEWQTIDIAPKDGTRILLFDKDRRPDTLIARFRHGRWWGDATKSGYSILWHDCTHWMPLPNPPT